MVKVRHNGSTLLLLFSSIISLFSTSISGFCNQQTSFLNQNDIILKQYRPSMILYESAGEILSETTTTTTTTTTLNEKEEDTLDKKKKKSKKTTLCFQAERKFESEKVPASSLSLNEFFHQHKSVLLTGRNNQLVECNNETYRKFYDVWVEKSKMANFTEPNHQPNTCWMYHVINSGTEFPGLKITSEMIMGCQLLESEGGNDDFPEYQFVLLDSQNKASGSKWMVWIYNQLTGEGDKEDTNSNNEEEERGKNSSNALMRFYVSAEDDDTNTILFHSNSNLQIDIEFPNIMVKLMPVSKRRAEKLGSDSVGNALDKEGKHTLNAFQEAYKSWIQTE